MTTDPAKNDEAAAEKSSEPENEGVEEQATVAEAAQAEAEPKAAEEPEGSANAATPSQESSEAATTPETEAAAESTAEEPAAEKAEAAEKPKPAPKPQEPARNLPSHEDIAAWANGKDFDNIGILFEGLALKRFDTFVTQIRAKDMLPQHWQIISETETPDDSVFDGLPEVKHLAQRYGNREIAEARVGAMKVAWRELRGRRPGLWQVPDLLAALRRIIDKGHEVDFNALLSGTRDLWLGMTLPIGRVQADTLWACIDLIRTGTKK